MTKRVLAAFLPFAAVGALAAGGAQGHPRDEGAGAAAEPSGTDLQAILGESYERTRHGLFRVGLPTGGSVLTHGPDPRRAMNPIDLEAGLPSAGATRAPQCAGDNYQHVLYGHLAVTPDLIASRAPVIRSAIEQLNALLNADSLASGGVTADYKVLCDAAGQLRVDSFAALSASFDDIVAAAKLAGFTDPNADYTIFFDAPSAACGIGTYERDSALSADNRSNAGGGYAVAYEGCWLDETPMHENAHAQGAVQDDTPNSTGTGGHCFEERDVLCYSPDGGDRNQGGTVSHCANRVAFDCGDDDYFDSSPEPGEYLSTHWNLGSALNRFIVFGQGAQGGEGSGAQPGQVDPPCRNRRCAIALKPGRERAGWATAPRGWTYYRASLPRGLSSISVRLAGPECTNLGAGCQTNLDLYVRRRKPPTAKRSDCRSRRPNSVERCRVRRPRSGRWYVGVRSLRAQSGEAFSLRVASRP